MTVPDVDQVVMLTNAIAPDQLGGLERYVRELAATLVRKGTRVTVLAKRVSRNDPESEVGDDGVHIIRHPVPSKDRRTFAVQYPVAVASGVSREMRRMGPRAVMHAHYPITALPLGMTRRPYVYTFHSPVHQEVLAERHDSYELPRATQRLAVQGVRALERRIISRAATTVVLSRYMRNKVELLAPTASSDCRIIPGGIDTDWFSPGTVVRDAWARPGYPLIVTSRRLTDRTGVLELVQAMPRVLARSPAALLAVTGEGHERAAIEREIRNLGLNERVRLLGRISDDDMRHWYRAADLTVTPTQRLEGFGLATGESLAVGTPALVTPVGANPELVADLDPLLVAPGSKPDDLSGAICRLLDQPGLLVRLRSRCRDHAHPLWSWDGVADRYLELYGQLARP